MHEQLTIFSSLKPCTKCKDLLPANTDYFYVRRASHDGLLARCKTCDNKIRVSRLDPNRTRRKPARTHEQNLELMRRYHWLNREAICKRKRKYNEENKDKQKEWVEANRDRERARVRNRWALIGKSEGVHTAEDIAAIYASQGGKCAYCTQDLNGIYDVDHIVPIVKGGSNWPSNLCCACVR